jgi:hypothetical protein
MPGLLGLYTARKPAAMGNEVPKAEFDTPESCVKFS